MNQQLVLCFDLDKSAEQVIPWTITRSKPLPRLSLWQVLLWAVGKLVRQLPNWHAKMALAQAEDTRCLILHLVAVEDE
jgi:hypothetical protein